MAASTYREISPYHKLKRLRRRMLRPAGLWRRRGYDVRFVAVDDTLSYKKVLFNSAEQARTVFQNLEAFGPSKHFPQPLERHNRAVWVEFVHGSAMAPIDGQHIPGLCQFYAQVHAKACRRLPLQETALIEGLDADIRFLGESGVLVPGLSDQLQQRLWACAPQSVWLGFDYTDPIGNNLIRRGECRTVCAIDIKNLRADTLLGMGLAKARHRWFTQAQERPFFANLRQLGAPDIEDYFLFIRRLEQIRRLTAKLRSKARHMTLWRARFPPKKRLQAADFI